MATWSRPEMGFASCFASTIKVLFDVWLAKFRNTVISLRDEFTDILI